MVSGVLHTGSPAPVKNIASPSNGGSCKGASSRNTTCNMVTDGGLLAYDSSWMPDTSDANPWIDLQFDDTYTILGVRVMQNLDKKGQYKELQLTFSDGSTQQVLVYTIVKHCGS